MTRISTIVTSVVLWLVSSTALSNGVTGLQQAVCIDTETAYALNYVGRVVLVKGTVVGAAKGTIQVLSWEYKYKYPIKPLAIVCHHSTANKLAHGQYVEITGIIIKRGHIEVASCTWYGDSTHE